MARGLPMGREWVRRHPAALDLGHEHSKQKRRVMPAITATPELPQGHRPIATPLAETRYRVSFLLLSHAARVLSAYRVLETQSLRVKSPWFGTRSHDTPPESWLPDHVQQSNS
jgi:hypothetical protein